MPQKKYDPGTPPKEAIDYFRAKGWKVGFDFRDVWKEEHAFAFTVAKAVTVDVLEGVRGSVDSAIAHGKTFAQFKKELQPELERLGWWGKKEMPDPKSGETRDVQLGSPRRLQVIFDTNISSAYAAGQWGRIERTKKLLPYLKYRLGPSEVHRPEHVAWDGLILPADDPWWDAHYPPNGWGCKCWVQQLTRAAAEKSGGPVDAPKTKMRDWVNTRTGQIEKVPQGITPGFDFNPGKAREQKNLDRFKEKLNGVSATAADAVQRAWMQPEVFGQWRQNPKGNIPVAVMDADTRKLMGAQQQTIYLSAETMSKQELDTKHPDLTDEDYCLLPDIIAKGEMFRADDQRLVFFKRGDKRFRAAVKTTADGRENYMVHLQEIPERNYQSAVKKYERLRE
jgi:hypothetical protein